LEEYRLDGERARKPLMREEESFGEVYRLDRERARKPLMREEESFGRSIG